MSDRISILTEADCTCSSKHPHLDEFVLYNVAVVHFEAMNDAQFWMSVTMADGRVFDVNFGATNPNAKGYARIEENA